MATSAATGSSCVIGMAFSSFFCQSPHRPCRPTGDEALGAPGLDSQTWDSTHPKQLFCVLQILSGCPILGASLFLRLGWVGMNSAALADFPTTCILLSFQALSADRNYSFAFRAKLMLVGTANSATAANKIHRPVSGPLSR